MSLEPSCRLYYCVKRIHKQETVYLGTSLQEASRFLGYGTCYGRGTTSLAAEVAAEREAERFKKVVGV